MVLIENNTDYVSTLPANIDSEAYQKFWIAAYTRPKSEKKAASQLRRLGIDTYVPIQTEIRQWSDRKKKIDVIVIPNIIFASVSDNDIDFIRQSSLVTKILSFPGQRNPAKIPSNQIERLKFMLKESDKPITFLPTDFKQNDSVTVIRGNLRGLKGTVERISEHRSRLIVYIDLLGGASLEIETVDLEFLV